MQFDLVYSVFAIIYKAFVQIDLIWMEACVTLKPAIPFSMMLPIQMCKLQIDTSTLPYQTMQHTECW